MKRQQPSSFRLTPEPPKLWSARKQRMRDEHHADARHTGGELSFCRDYLLRIAHGENFAVAIPVAGTAMQASAAAIRTFVPPEGKLLVYSNGVLGDHLSTLCQAIGVAHSRADLPPWRPLSALELSCVLSRDPAITHVIAAHCEASSGMLNPIAEIAQLCQWAGRKLLVNAVACFGALPLDLREAPCQAIIIGSDQCLQGPPGLAWIIADRGDLQSCKGYSRALDLDLWDRWECLEGGHSPGVAPPAHLIAVFAQALRDHRAEGGQEARLKRYRRNHAILVAGMRGLGFETPLPDRHVAPILAAFIAPDLPRYDSTAFYKKLAQYGFRVSLQPAAMRDTFLVECMGALTEKHMAAAVTAMRCVLRDMGGPLPLGS